MTPEQLKQINITDRLVNLVISMRDCPPSKKTRRKIYILRSRRRVNSLGDLIRQALSAPVVELVGPRMKGLSLADLIKRAQADLEYEDIQAWITANFECGRFDDSNYQDRCNEIMQEIEERRGPLWVLDNCIN